MEVILVKYGEIALKKRNRREFEQQLKNNCARALALGNVRLERINGRIKITLDKTDHVPSAIDRLQRVFGVHSIARTTQTLRSLDAIIEEVFNHADASLRDARTFAVASRRSSNTFPMTSPELNTVIGSEIQKRYPHLVVDLSKPECVVTVEVRGDGAYICTDTNQYPGPGGLPVGSAGKALSLLSGGIDSPVASWLTMKRGLTTDAVYFHSAPFTGEKAREKVLDLARVLAEWNSGSIRVFTPSLSEVQREISKNAPSSYWTILFRRSMHRIAERIVNEYGYQLMVTGDSVAQVASQTPENLGVIDAASSILTLRPLTGYDKSETIRLSQKIGTFDISTRPFEDCCSLFTPKNPKTASTEERVKRIERGLDLMDLEDRAFTEMEVFNASVAEGVVRV